MASGGRPSLPTRSRTTQVHLQLEPPKDDDADDDGAALAAAFRRRLDEEGGETAFRLKSDASRVKSTLEDGANSIKDAGSKLLDVGTSRDTNRGLLDDNSWRLTVGFFIALIVISVAGAVFNQPPSDPGAYGGGYGSTIDNFTSDGQPLTFGKGAAGLSRG